MTSAVRLIRSQQLAQTAVTTEQVELGVTDANSSCLIREPGVERTKFVVMPMRL